MAGGLLGALSAITTDPERNEYAIRTATVDAVTVDQLRKAAAAYRHSYRHVPSTALLPVAHAQLNLVLSLQPGHQRQPQRHALLSQLGEMAALAAVLSYLDLGNRLDGDTYLNLAHQVSRAIDSPELSALLLAGRAFHMAYAGDPEGGLDCALAAVDHAQSGASRRMQAWVHAVASEMHATTGDEYACRTALDAARTCLDGPMDDERWGGIGSFDLGKVDGYEGGDLVRLGRHDEALPILDAALDRLGTTMPRHRATAYADRADAYAAAGYSDAAVQDAHAALDLLEEVHHAETLRRITSLHKGLRAAGAPATRALAEHLIDVRSTMTTGRSA